MISLQTLFDTIRFQLVGLTWIEFLDLGLVLVAIYFLLGIAQHNQAGILLRGTLVLSSLLFAITLILPLPAFDWLVRGVLIAILITTPIIFQPELRRLLEQIGRNTNLSWQVQQTTIEKLLSHFVRAMEAMAATKTGALIAIEGQNSLQSVIETGVSIDGEVSSELIQAIFYPSNPLHDGGVIIREDRIVAAGCVLPLTDRPLYTKRRLGTRHRAAAGLSEKSDALLLVVSEETGAISVAYQGELHRPLDVTALRKHLLDFYTPSQPVHSSPSFPGQFIQLWKQYWQDSSASQTKRVLSLVGRFFVALFVSLALWAFVFQQINPVEPDRIEDIPLRVENIPPNTTLLSPLPDTVSAIIKTTSQVRPTLSSNSFQASLSLRGLEPGQHRLDINVRPIVPRVRVDSVEPKTVDLELAPIITRTLKPEVELTGERGLSRAYKVRGAPIISPNQVLVSGAEPLVNQVQQVQATISVEDASSTLTERRLLQAVDESGREVRGVTIQPTHAQVEVVIQRRVNAKDVGVRAVTEGKPVDGYWVSSINVTPSGVTLQSEQPDQLAQVGGLVDTLPVNLNQAEGNISVQVPLDLPEGVSAIDNQGETANIVRVEVEIAAREGNLSVSRPIEMIGLPPAYTSVITPSTVNVLLSGPLPTLNKIESDPELVQVSLKAPTLEPGEYEDLDLTVVAPENVGTELNPATVSVVLSEENRP